MPNDADSFSSSADAIEGPTGLREGISLEGLKPVNSGHFGLIYAHPNCHAIVIKIPHPHIRDSHRNYFSFRRTPLRRFRVYTSFLRYLKEFCVARTDKRISHSFLAPYFGLAGTDEGLAALSYAERDKDGGYAPTLKDLVERRMLDADAQEAFRRLFPKIKRNPLVTKDLHNRNILYSYTPSLHSSRFAIIDGLGDPNLIPMKSFFMYFNKRRKKRWEERALDFIRQYYPDSSIRSAWETASADMKTDEPVEEDFLGVSLKTQTPFAEGQRFAIYPYPHDPALVVKTAKTADSVRPNCWMHTEKWRLGPYLPFYQAAKTIIALYASGKPYPTFLPPFIGFIDTDKGLGMLSKAYKTKRGDYAPTLAHILQTHIWTAANQRDLIAFSNALMESNISISSLDAENILYAYNPATDACHFVLAGGFEEDGFFRTIIPPLNRLYMRRLLKNLWKAIPAS
jgi:hypothetical protein